LKIIKQPFSRLSQIKRDVFDAQSSSEVLYFQKPFQNMMLIALKLSSCSFKLDVALCSVWVIPLQHKSWSVCMSFVRLGHHNG